ncbi:carboxypeptidase regulatory-like domain-containing protein [Aggregicoccus sp. 17bor-14]|uniref:carboxypeptidase-like regulatory domain-containing protein n=1 Tax=Myxococcaceae TaxID=31 RepID=UPI00129CE267|nr:MULTISPECIES: carboxypeptidase-like regulatory domain-containing protein [Myxococcaceae]MBF5042414.1 carboxypeptidase regulatory-like domain-containing protein [Simulacricoccus sp. 17bor-14]MRI88186.1 carboxypeptidase regulatory-like domain-containing protein [Aggregicoccus sp. 17bor-14]
MSDRVLGVLLVLGLSSGARAAEVRGQVTEATTKQPVAEIVVTATSPNLQGEQVVVTDAQGEYRISQLPVGEYTLRFEHERFMPYERAALPVRDEYTLRVNAELLRSRFLEAVTTNCRAPTIDIQSTSTGVNVGADFLRNVPLLPGH